MALFSGSSLYHLTLISTLVKLHDYGLTIVKRLFKAQECLPLLLGSHILWHDLLSSTLMLTSEECLSNNMTSEKAISTSCKADNSSAICNKVIITM